MKLRTFALLIAMIPLASITRAEALSTQPATQPEAESGSPLATALQMNVAMRAYDAPGMIALMHTATPDQKRYARAAAQSDVYVARLLVAAAEKFGKVAVAKVQNAISDVSDDDIRAASVLLEGEDKASLIGKDDKFEFHYIRINGDWKVDVTRAFEDLSVPMNYIIDETIRRGNWAKVAAQEVASGRYESLEELIAAIKGRFEDSANAEEAPAATQPSK